MEIKTASFVTSLAQYHENDPINLLQLAVVGKSNVGKSSLINALCNRRKLCKTSATPGKTRLINIFLINEQFHLVDLPGYGFAKVDKKEKERWGAMMDHYFQDSTKLMHVLLLVDIRHDPTQDDVAMAQYFRQMDIPFTIVATKADKISRGARMKQLAPICRQMLVQPWEVIVSSSEDKTGCDKLLELIEELLQEEAELDAAAAQAEE
ncbi:MAG: ribosome biogenesis GTP-binding protein YihA/YsxC [bacterium]|nr:ribosome biogenesis GTP-binding protein YihA/YsxC [Clostridia bacterium]MDD6142735.1 ribosome biogenesis GTP-binding protein YihA/YsxC [bacterium]